MIGQYTKSIVMILGAALAVLGSAITDSVITPVEYVNIAIAFVTAIGVYKLPNLSSGWRAFTKTFVGVAGGVLAALATVVMNATSFASVSPSDWMAVAVVGISTLAVYIFPNSASTEALAA